MHEYKQLESDWTDTYTEPVNGHEHFDFVPDACVFTNLKFRIQNVNIAGLHLLGHTLDLLERMPFFQFISLWDRHAVVALSTALLGGRVSGSDPIEITVLPRRRIQVTCAAKVILMRNSSGAPEGYLWLIRNAAAQMREEESLPSSQQTEGVSLFSRGMVHEFSNILAAIRIHADVIRLSRSSRDRRESLDEIRNSCDKAADLLRQVRAMTSDTDFGRAKASPALNDSSRLRIKRRSFYPTIR